MPDLVGLNPADDYSAANERAPGFGGLDDRQASRGQRHVFADRLGLARVPYSQSRHRALIVSSVARAYCRLRLPGEGAYAPGSLLLNISPVFRVSISLLPLRVPSESAGGALVARHATGAVPTVRPSTGLRPDPQEGAPRADTARKRVCCEETDEEQGLEIRFAVIASADVVIARGRRPLKLHLNCVFAVTFSKSRARCCR